MRNRMCGGVRGQKTKVGRKLLRFPPTQLGLLFLCRCIRNLLGGRNPFSHKPVLSERIRESY